MWGWCDYCDTGCEHCLPSEHYDDRQPPPVSRCKTGTCHHQCKNCHDQLMSYKISLRDGCTIVDKFKFRSIFESLYGIKLYFSENDDVPYFYDANCNCCQAKRKVPSVLPF